MKCALAFATYTCSNASGTTCTKVLTNTLAINANATCGAGDLIVLTQPEYTALNTAITTAQTTGTTAQTSATTAGNLANSATTLANTAQTAANKAQAAIDAGVKVQIAPMTATADEYQAVTAIFAVVLTAACVVWGVKQLLRLLRNPSEA